MASFQFPDWDFGDYGLLGAKNAPKGSWSGKNVILTKRGDLCVRPGVKNVTHTGGATGQVQDIHQAPQGNGVIYIQNNKVVYFNPSTPPAGGITTSASSFTANPPTVGQWSKVGSRVYVVSTDGVAYIDSLSTLTRLASAPLGTGLALFGVRLVVTDAAATAGTLEFSGLSTGTPAQAADITQWPGAANQIIIGNQQTLGACFAQRSQLTIMGSGGIYVVTGTLGSTQVVRKSNTRIGPYEPSASYLSKDDVIWYTETGGMHPQSFDGANFRTFRHVTLSTLAINLVPAVTVFEYPYTNDAVFTTPYAAGAGLVFLATAWVYLRGVWSKHEFPATINAGDSSNATANIAAYPTYYSPDPSSDTDELNNYLNTTSFVLTDDGDTGVAPVFWAWSPDLDRPGSETDQSVTVDPTLRFAPERAGDASSQQVSAQFDLPEKWSEGPEEWRVSTVTVDFTSWNTGGSLTNHFDLTVDALRRYNTDSPSSSQTLSWDEAGSLSDTSGTFKRITFSFGDQGYGAGYQLRFTNCRGVAFRPPKVSYEITKQRGTQ